jgi:hypothetical protein
MQRGERLVLTCLGCLADPGLTRAFGWPRHGLIVAILGLITLGTLITTIHRTVWIAHRLKEKERLAHTLPGAPVEATQAA